MRKQLLFIMTTLIVSSVVFGINVKMNRTSSVGRVTNTRTVFDAKVYDNKTSYTSNIYSHIHQNEPVGILRWKKEDTLNLRRKYDNSDSVLISKTSVVTVTNIILFGEPLSDRLTAPSVQQENGLHENCQLPYQIEFNGYWELSHSCSCCGTQISFGCFDKKGITGFRKIKGLSSKFTDTAYLKEITNLFSSFSSAGGCSFISLSCD